MMNRAQHENSPKPGGRGPCTVPLPLKPCGLRANCPRSAPEIPTQAIFASEPESVAAARRFVSEVLDQDAPDLDAEKADDVRLIVSELVTNSIRYGTRPGDSVLVAIESTAKEIRIEVHDHVRRRPHLAEPDEQGGRGMFIVEALAETWGVADKDFGKAVWVVVTR